MERNTVTSGNKVATENSADIVLTEHQDGIAILMLNEPVRLNLFSDEMRGALLVVLETAAKSASHVSKVDERIFDARIYA